MQCCQLGNNADTFGDFFPFKKATKPYLLWESPVLPCEVLLSQHARTHPCTHTHTHTHISLSLSLSVCLLSFCSARAHLSLSLSASAQFLFSERQRKAELNSVKHRYYVACFSNFTCKYSQNHRTAIVIILWVFYLIRQRLDYKDLCRLTSCKGELVM